jgi:hypothetical protein
MVMYIPLIISAIPVVILTSIALYAMGKRK